MGKLEKAKMTAEVDSPTDAAASSGLTRQRGSFYSKRGKKGSRAK